MQNENYAITVILLLFLRDTINQHGRYLCASDTLAVSRLYIFIVRCNPPLAHRSSPSTNFRVTSPQAKNVTSKLHHFVARP